MTALVLDAGALVALERDDRRVWELLREATDTEEIVQVPAGVVAQAWRDGGRQVLLIRALAHCDEIPLDSVTARASGTLCGRAGSTDVIDASVVVAASRLTARDSVAVITSDPDDIRRLASALGTPVTVVRV